MKNSNVVLTAVCAVFGLFSISTVNAQWVSTNGPYGGQTMAIMAQGNEIDVGTWLSGFFRSTDGGATWRQLNTGLPTTGIYCLLRNGSDILTGTQGNGVYVTTDGGTDWTSSGTGITYPFVLDLVKSGSVIIAAASGGPFRSTDGGSSWTAANSGITTTEVVSLVIRGGEIFAGVKGDGIYRSTDLGVSWSPLDSMLLFSNRVAATSSQLIATTYGNKICRSTDGGATWNLMGQPSIWEVKALTIDKQETVFAGTRGDGVLRWEVGDTSWTRVDSGLTNLNVWSLSIDTTVVPARIYVGTEGGLFVSTDNGTVWRLAGPSAADVKSLSADADTIFATDGAGVYALRGASTEWERIAGSPEAEDYLVVGRHQIIANVDGVFHSPDHGSSWSMTLDLTMYIYGGHALALDDSLVFAGTDVGVYCSTDSGSTSRMVPGC